eukprot:scaffold103793_cov65-Phaeocystis_antarctica.AAC.3
MHTHPLRGPLLIPHRGASFAIGSILRMEMRGIRLLLMPLLSSTSALIFTTARPGAIANARVAHPRMQFGDFLKGLEEAKKSLEKDVGILSGGQELQDDGETEQEAKSRAERAAKNKQDELAEEDDIPTKLFKFFIGDPEEGDVQGIARTSSAPDTYPATKTEFAAKVDGDSAAIAHLRPLLKNTNLEFLSDEPTTRGSTAGRPRPSTARSTSLGLAWWCARPRAAPCAAATRPRGMPATGSSEGASRPFYSLGPMATSARRSPSCRRWAAPGWRPSTSPRRGRASAWTAS